MTRFLRLSDDSAHRGKHVLNTVVEFSVQRMLVMLCTFALCDINVDAYHPLRTTIFSEGNSTASLNPSNFASRENNAILSIVLLSPFHKSLFAQPFRPREVLRVHSRSPFSDGRLGNPVG